MKFSCMMELNKYPLDVQVCTMEIASCEWKIAMISLPQSDTIDQLEMQFVDWLIRKVDPWIVRIEKLPSFKHVPSNRQQFKWS